MNIVAIQKGRFVRIPKIFLSSKSDNFESFKTYLESFNWLEKVFYSSSFFGLGLPKILDFDSPSLWAALLEIVEFWNFFSCKLVHHENWSLQKKFEVHRQKSFSLKSPWNYILDKVPLKMIFSQNFIFNPVERSKLHSPTKNCTQISKISFSDIAKIWKTAHAKFEFLEYLENAWGK